MHDNLKEECNRMIKTLENQSGKREARLGKEKGKAPKQTQEVELDSQV